MRVICLFHLVFKLYNITIFLVPIYIKHVFLYVFMFSSIFQDTAVLRFSATENFTLEW